ncbi:hypothetical protein ILYODFUR_023240 [Ilyodon furcidens]|uniref:Uncharacterized protein n=1 Tax=Ilyodon furcidens TaxID=33524 RepID=A0ABV0UUG2_9TELE
MTGNRGVGVGTGTQTQSSQSYTELIRVFDCLSSPVQTCQSSVGFHFFTSFKVRTRKKDLGDPRLSPLNFDNQRQFCLIKFVCLCKYNTRRRTFSITFLSVNVAPGHIEQSSTSAKAGLVLVLN